MRRRCLDRPTTYSLYNTMRFLRIGHRDPTLRLDERRLQRATRYDTGPATLDVEDTGSALQVTAWGPGAEEALERAPRLLGLHDTWPAPDPPHPLLRRLHRSIGGLRLLDTGQIVHSLVPIVLQQQVTWAEAVACWGNLVRWHGEPAPGPLDLTLPLPPEGLRGLGVAEYRRAGVPAKRATVLVSIGRRAKRLEEAAAMDDDEAYRRLTALNGIGPWTAGCVLGLGLGRPDAVVLGDVHMPNMVAWGLDGVARGTDDEMLERLEPWRGQRFRVVRLMLGAGIQAPRRGPKRAPTWME